MKKEQYWKNRKAGKRGQGEEPTLTKLIKPMPKSTRTLFRDRMRVRPDKVVPVLPIGTNHERMLERKAVRLQQASKGSERTTDLKAS